MSKRRPSSHRWLQEHHSDPFVKAARLEGYRSRAAYKLLEIQQQMRLIHPGDTVVELGAAPGGWTQVALAWVGASGRYVALDILPMDPVAVPLEDGCAQALVLQGDFLEQTTLDALALALGQPPGVWDRPGAGVADVVLSDMAPNMTGFKAADQGRGELLAESAFEFARAALRPGGVLVVKLFQGPGFHDILRVARREYRQVRVVKPEASRGRSPEQYLVASGFSAAVDSDAPGTGSSYSGE
ncbi:MAG: RlmE family RNA methyltransferase [Magnetococcus sp. WYHC-3]